MDADLLSRDKHRFPNLVCMKIAGYWIDKGATVKLLYDYNFPDDYDHIYISKVFTDTPVPDFISDLVNNTQLGDDRIHIGGTGFYFDSAPNLPEEIEHHMPYYSLYDDFINNKVEEARKMAELKEKPFNEKRFMVQFDYYKNHSIGFITRGCFRKCPFCVNKKYDRAFCHSPLEEFFDKSRKKLCFLDDNFLSYSKWRELLTEIIATGRPYRFKQGLDERLLTDEKCSLLFNSNYDGDFIFAFDNVSDYELIHRKLEMIKKYKGNKSVMFYVLVGFNGTDEVDIENAFKRIELLFRYSCLPYIMRYMSKDKAPWKDSEYRGMYIMVPRNQTSNFQNIVNMV